MTLIREGGGPASFGSHRIVFYNILYLPINLESLEIILLYGNNYENSFFFLLMRSPVLYIMYCGRRYI